VPDIPSSKPLPHLAHGLLLLELLALIIWLSEAALVAAQIQILVAVAAREGLELERVCPLLLGQIIQSPWVVVGMPVLPLEVQTVLTPYSRLSLQLVVVAVLLKELMLMV
jgi:hypothetical protein